MIECPVIRQFADLSRFHSVAFTDKSLSEISAKNGGTDEEAAVKIARYLLTHFPSGVAKDFPVESPRLKKTVALLCALYDKLVLAHFSKDSLLDDPLMTVLCSRFRAKSVRRLTLYKKEKRNALQFHEEMVTFPDRVGLPSRVEHDKELDLFDLFSNPSSNEEIGNVGHLALFFYKHYALPGVTWQRHVENWGRSGGNASRLPRLVFQFPCNWMAPTDGVTERTEHFLGLKQYTYEKTYEALLAALEVEEVDASTKEKLIEEFSDPAFRMDVVYFIMHKEELEELQAGLNEKLDSWLLKLKECALQEEAVDHDD